MKTLLNIRIGCQIYNKFFFSNALQGIEKNNTNVKQKLNTVN